MDYNEIVQMMLKKSHPDKDVKVVLDKCKYGGIWRWNSSLQFHERIPLNDLKARFPRFSEAIEYLRTIPLIQISTQQILNFKDPMQPF
jgi:hypothetical protein